MSASARSNESGDALVVDPHDDVALANPGLAGRALDRGRNDEAGARRADRQADARVRPLRVVAEALVLGGREQVGVRVVEPARILTVVRSSIGSIQR